MSGKIYKRMKRVLNKFMEDRNSKLTPRQWRQAKEIWESLPAPERTYQNFIDKFFTEVLQWRGAR